MIKYKIYEPEDNPFDLLLADITHRCNMECANCYIPNRHIPDMDVEKLYEFLERLICVALPRTRDFRGLSFKSFDGRGNYNFGIKEQIIFTEIDYDKIEAIRGLNITITTTAKTDNEAYHLLKYFGLPLRDKPVSQEVEEAA